tara:strand:- start:1283 stop:2521 length:1239 start_codon:yes stop_codon:yes gene_type:complete
MALRLRGATSGYIELKAPASAGDNTLTLPTNNGGANQLLKIDGSGNLSWQANLTFDGTQLNVKGSGTDILKIESTDAGAQGTNLILQHSPGAGNMAANDVISLLQFNGVDDSNNPTTYSSIRAVATDVSNNSEKGDLTFFTRNGSTFAECMRINSNGDLNLGNNPTNQYGYKLNIQDSAILYAQTASNNGTELKLYLDHGNTVANFGTVSTSHLAFVTANTEKVRITSDGDLTIDNGDLKIGTAGKGIDFSINSDGSRAVTTNGNLFDDYEEGTFNAQLGGATNHGTHEITGGGTYTKIGRKVYMQISFQNSDLNDGASGQVIIKNLPFTFVDSTVNSSHVCAGVSADFVTTNVTYPHSGDMNRYVWQLIASAGHIKGYRVNDGGSMTDWDASHWVASSMELRLNISSLTAT